MAGIQLSKNINENIEHFNMILNVDKSFDIIHRVVEIAGRQAALYCVNGLCKNQVQEELLEFMMERTEQDLSEDVYELPKRIISYGSVSILTDTQTAIDNILMGVSILMIDGYDVAYAIDLREYPARGVQEPAKDRVLRGSRDGFVETLVFNTALVRRRIRDADLIMEIFKVGDASKTDIAVCYMGKRVNHEFLDEIRRRLKTMKVDSLTMNQESLAECLYHAKWINPFPKFKYTERPDATAACILEGSIAILVDNSPAAMILPCNVFDIIEEADDYYFPPITGTYLRLSRITINILTVFLTPIWLLLISNPQYMPDWLSFTMVKDPINVPIIFQFLILEFSIDGLRLAALNTPNMLSTPLSVIAALIIGDFAASSGWFNPEPMLYMAFVSIANYVQVSFELGYALKFMRIILLISTAVFGLWGFVAGTVFVIVSICTNKTIAGKSYIYPLIPFNAKQLARRLFRINLRNVKKS